MRKLSRNVVLYILDKFWRIRVGTGLVACNLCGSHALSKSEAYGRLFLTCGECGGIQAREIPESVQLLGMGIHGSWGGALQGGEREHFLVHFTRSMLGAKTFLLYGSGATRAPLVLKHESISAVALDVSSSAVGYLNSTCGSEIAYTPKSIPKGIKFDVVIACEVFEHFNNPRRWFSFIADMVRDGGVLCGTTDFFNGISIAESGSYPGYMSFRGHTFYWSEKSMGWLARSVGLNFVSFEMESPGSIYPDAVYGVLFPNKRVFFLTRDDTVHQSLCRFKEEHPVLPLDARSYWEKLGYGDVERLIEDARCAGCVAGD